ncbi:hypothetical protein [Allosphingosinicella sp.]|jgi:hypothetical protein|uniref:hypothetical protein n=1 Tax=Allosphingosinicella sp. TaxID=2823234 RepID=UPI002F17427B
MRNRVTMPRWPAWVLLAAAAACAYPAVTTARPDPVEERAHAPTAPAPALTIP